MQDETLTKVCTKCGEAKVLEAFHAKKGGRMGRRSTCRKCEADKYLALPNDVKKARAKRNHEKHKGNAERAEKKKTRDRERRNTDEFRLQLRRRRAEDEEFAERERKNKRKRRSDPDKRRREYDLATQRHKERYAADVDYRNRVIEIDRLRRTPDYYARLRDKYASDEAYRARRLQWNLEFRIKRRENEEFDAFMERMEAEAAEWEATNHTTTEEET
ncbi:hypothetical protein [Sinorhizobium sp. BJ1]|uniref:hypothetical protein n=1 Tax=Sinorhizobium sp. BJ1 TaxID=2035455 RepID=UPI000BEA7B74|nr:hypothetical protein [Sinorhizobium sp. BJ1]PDT86519.1 hypothetical protein CO676_02190 [Sinorhizobium sp. BJ1]